MTEHNPQPNPDETRSMPPTQDMPHVARVTPRRSRRRMAGRGSFVPPLWSLALMLAGVACVSSGVVLGVYLLRGNMPPQNDPVVVVVTSPPTEPPAAIPSAFPSPTPAFTGGVSVPVPDFALEGPTLPPVILSPTPDVISIGRTVQVVNVGEVGLNVRAAPGIENPVEFTAAENSYLEITGGPESSRGDGFTWWKVEDPFTSQTGWAVELYMVVQPESAP